MTDAHVSRRQLTDSPPRQVPSQYKRGGTTVNPIDSSTVESTTPTRRMAAAATAGSVQILTAEELEELHVRLATALSLNDEANMETTISDILAGREEPVPEYSPEATASHDLVQQQIDVDSIQVWDNLFRSIEMGQIDAVTQFVELGVDVARQHPRRMQYPIYHAVRHSQTNMMRHLINLKVDVNVFSVPDRLLGVPADNERQRTPLMNAAEQGNLNICKILCESAFADPMLVAPDGQTAQRLAARNGHKEVVDYLPANRGGAYLRLSYDFHHRWNFIRVACHGIYDFCRVTFFEIPRYLFVTLPWDILKASGRELTRLYRNIPPISEWGGIIARAVKSLLRGIKDFLVGTAKVIANTPKAMYKAGKYIVKRTWKGIRALPGLIKIGARKTWEGLKVFGRWLQEFLLSIVSFIHTLISAVLDFFRSITLANIIAGFQNILRGIFIDLPRILWQGLLALGRGIHATLVSFFGGLYWCVFCIIYGLQWVCMYVPKRVGMIILQIAGGIQGAFTELFIWLFPKTMA